jgi:hypothetical protein
MKLKWLIPLFIILVFSAVILVSCSEQVDRLWLQSPGWSRAQFIGQTSLDQPVSMALDEGGIIYFLTTHQVESDHQLNLMALSPHGEMIWARGLGISLVDLTTTQINWEGDDLIVTWLDDKSLYAIRIDETGEPLTEPIHLSLGIEVDSFDLATRPGHSTLIWFGGNWREPGIYMLSLSDQPGEPVLIDPGGISPTVQYDQEGNLHASWLAYPGAPTQPYLHYANYPGGVYQPDRDALLTQLFIRSDSGLTGPWLGIDSTDVYIFWNEVIRSGRRMNMGDPNYVHFPNGDPTAVSEPKLIQAPNTNKITYEMEPQGKLVTGERANLTTDSHALISPDMIVVDSNSGGEIALALRVRIPDRYNNMVSQVGILYLNGGESAGYQLLSYTSQSSRSPALIHGTGGHVYLNWLERIQGSGYAIYFASTTDGIQEAYAPLTSGDVSRMVAETIFGLLKGAVFSILFVPIWFAVPGLILILTSRFRKGSDSLFSPFTFGSWGLAIVFYWVGKYLTLRDANTYIPFSAWIPVIPPSLGLPLQLGVPVIGTSIALWVAWHYANRDSAKSAAIIFVIYGGIDCLITLAVYGEYLFARF